MELLKNKLALVTGAGGGLGSAIAHGLADQGARVIVADLDLTRAQAVAMSMTSSGAQAWAEFVDVTDRQGVNGWANKMTSEHGPIDILVNCAGITGRSRVDDEHSPEVWDRLCLVNMTGLFKNLTMLPKK